jgi:hypothetical protein
MIGLAFVLAACSVLPLQTESGLLVDRQGSVYLTREQAEALELHFKALREEIIELHKALMSRPLEICNSS